MTRLLLLLGLAACRHAPPAAPAALPPPPRAVWIDADPAVGVPDRDVDDGVALLQALRSPELAVRGVSLVFGNAPLELADPIGRALVADWAPEVPVHTGAAGPSLQPTEASEALADALRREPLTLLVLGPATNIAATLVTHPELVDRVVEVVAVAGRLPGQRFTTGTTNPRAHRDFNFEQDAEAFRVLLDLDVPVTLAPFEISRKVWVDEARLQGWSTSPDAALLVAPARGWLDLWERVFAVDGFNPFDTLAVGWLTHPAHLTCEPGAATIEEGPDDRTEGAMQGDEVVTKPYLVVRPAQAGRQVTWCHDVDAAAFLADLDRRLGVRAETPGRAPQQSPDAPAPSTR